MILTPILQTGKLRFSLNPVSLGLLGHPGLYTSLAPSLLGWWWGLPFLLTALLLCGPAVGRDSRMVLLVLAVVVCPLWVPARLPELCCTQSPLPGRAWPLLWPQTAAALLVLRHGAHGSLRDTNPVLLPHISHAAHELLVSFLHSPEWCLLQGEEMGSLLPSPLTIGG